MAEIKIKESVTKEGEVGGNGLKDWKERKQENEGEIKEGNRDEQKE